MIDKDTLVAEKENIKRTQFYLETASDIASCLALDMLKDALDELETEDIIEKISNEITRLQDETMDGNHNFCSGYNEGRFDALTDLDKFLDTLK